MKTAGATNISALEREYERLKQEIREQKRAERKKHDAEIALTLKKEAMDTPFLDIGQAAARYHISSKTVYRWIKEQGFPAQRIGGRLYRIFVPEADEWMKKRV